MSFHSTNLKKKTFSEQRGLPISIHSAKFSLCCFTTITLVLLFQILAFERPFVNHFSCLGLFGEDDNQTKPPRLAFLPLKDLRFADSPMEGNTWFMSSINDSREEGDAEYMYFPSEASDGRVLCLAGRSTSNGTVNYYALASPATLPNGMGLVRGLTFVSDTYYDYGNLWHGLSAMVPFISWHERKECVLPKRWVLYHRGELRTSMSPWLRELLKATLGQEVVLEGFEGSTGPSCFEKAVVVRHHEGSMSKKRKREVYDLMRCKARSHCDVRSKVEDLDAIRLTLFLRVGTRSFKDEAAVIGIFDKECRKIKGCRLKVARPNNLTFCDQVRLMSETDVLVSSHGAQMTNMFFMNKNSSVMEFFPKGWLELAGVGQYVFQWIADSSEIRHRGQWRDPRGDTCPEKDQARCFSFYKDGKIGHDEVYFRDWAAQVLREMKEYKLAEASKNSSRQALMSPSPCRCSRIFSDSFLMQSMLENNTNTMGTN